MPLKFFVPAWRTGRMQSCTSAYDGVVPPRHAGHVMAAPCRHVDDMSWSRLRPSTYSTTAHCGRRSVIGDRKRGQSVKTFCPFLSFFCWLKGFSMEGVQACNTQNKNHGKVCKYLVHSRFPPTRFLPTSVPLYERVTVPYNEQLINPSSPTTME